LDIEDKKSDTISVFLSQDLTRRRRSKIFMSSFDWRGAYFFNLPRRHIAGWALWRTKMFEQYFSNMPFYMSMTGFITVLISSVTGSITPESRDQTWERYHWYAGFPFSLLLFVEIMGGYMPPWYIKVSLVMTAALAAGTLIGVAVRSYKMLAKKGP
jgi:hypothetical protein